MCPAGAHARLTGVIAVLCMRTPALQTSQCMDSADQSVGATVVSGPRSVECHSTLPLSRLVIFLSWARVLFLASIADQVPWWSDHEESPGIRWLLWEVSLLSRQQLMGSSHGGNPPRAVGAP